MGVACAARAGYRENASHYIWRMFSFFIFYSKHFLRSLSTDILETCSRDVALAPIEVCYTNFPKVFLEVNKEQKTHAQSLTACAVII